MQKQKATVGGMDKGYFINQREVVLRKEKDILLRRIAEIDKKIMETRKLKYQLQHEGIAEEGDNEQDEKFILRF